MITHISQFGTHISQFGRLRPKAEWLENRRQGENKDTKYEADDLRVLR